MKKDFKGTENKITGFENQVRQLIGVLKQDESIADKEQYLIENYLLNISRNLRLQVERDLEISKNNSMLLLQNKQPEIRQSRQSLPANNNGNSNSNNFVPSVKVFFYLLYFSNIDIC